MRVIVASIIPRNMIINLGCASVDNHIPQDDIFDYHPIRECNIYIMWKDQDIICCHSACNSDSQLFVDLYRGGVILSPGTGTAWKKYQGM